MEMGAAINWRFIAGDQFLISDISAEGLTAAIKPVSIVVRMSSEQTYE